MRGGWIRGKDVFIMVFSCEDSYTFESLNDWKESLEKCTHKKISQLPVLLCSTKSDSSDKQVSEEEMKELAAKFGCKYLEASALSGENVRKVFEIATEIALEARKVKKNREEEAKVKRSTLRKESKRLLQDKLWSAETELVSFLKGLSKFKRPHRKSRFFGLSKTESVTEMDNVAKNSQTVIFQVELFYFCKSTRIFCKAEEKLLLEQKKEEKLKKKKEAQAYEEARQRCLVSFFAVVGMDKSPDNKDMRVLFPSQNLLDSSLDIFKQAWKPVVLSAYPNNPPTGDVACPDNLWMFCFPRGVEIVREVDRKKSYGHFCFVMTTSTGLKFYGNCVTVYEKVSKSFLESLQDVLIQNKPKGETHNIPELPEYAFSPKVLCIVSRQPYQRNLLSSLKTLVQFHNTNCAPYSAEELINFWTMQVLEPSIGQYVQVEMARDKKFEFHAPNSLFSHPNRFDISLDILFDVMCVENIVKLVSSLLTEQKVLLLSSHQALLGFFMESLSSLLYPFAWHHAYVPILPKLLIDFVSSPMPFFMGVHKSYFPNSYRDSLNVSFDSSFQLLL